MSLVSILMGSDSDLPVMQEAANVLEELGISPDVHVLSAHRTPGAVVEYVENAEKAGTKVFFSTVQMPPGIPVATVAIGGAKNAGILAAQIIGASDPAIRDHVSAYKKKLNAQVLEKDAKLQEKGFKKYLEEKGLV